MATLSIVVRPVEIDDLNSVADLMVEMDKFYDEPDRESVETKVGNMQEVLFGTPPAAYLLVAQDQESSAIVGMAAFSFLWPAVGSTRSLYLKELYVREERRRDGTGRRLMDALSAIALTSKCSRLEWTTDRSNSNARHFYSSLSADVADNKLMYRMNLYQSS